MLEPTTQSILDDITNGANQTANRLQAARLEADKSWSRIMEDMDATADEKVDLGKVKADELKQSLATRKKIHDANFETFGKSVQQVDQDLTGVVESLETVLASINIEYASLQKPTREQESRLQRAKQEIEEAQQALGVAKIAWFRKKSRAARAEAAIKEATQRLSLMEERVRKEVRGRLANTTMNERLDLFQATGAKAEELMKKGIAETEEKLTVVAKYRQQIQKILEQASAAREKLGKEIDAKKPLLETELSKLDSMVSGSQDQVAQKNKVEDLRAELTDLTGRHNAAQAILEDKMVSQERFAKIQEALQKQLAAHKIHRGILRSQMEDRAVSFNSSLAIMRNAANEQGAKKIHDAGNEIDHRLDIVVSEASVASDKVIAEVFEAYEKRMKRLYAIKGATKEAEEDAMRRLEATRQRLNVFFDIDMKTGQSKA
ncbi:MAG: hypothetical protein WCT16_05070 [Candidatus Buchananbacteria bacterium]